MNPLVRRYLRTAIFFLVIGLGIGVWMIYAREFAAPQPARIRSAHTHALLVGFVMLMITGVALWMFPRPRPDDHVYRPILADLAWWGIAIGTLVRVLLELTLPIRAEPLLRGALVGAGVVQALGIILFFGTMWTRIRQSGAGSERR